MTKAITTTTLCQPACAGGNFGKKSNGQSPKASAEHQTILTSVGITPVTPVDQSKRLDAIASLGTAAMPGGCTRGQRPGTRTYVEYLSSSALQHSLAEHDIVVLREGTLSRPAPAIITHTAT